MINMPHSYGSRCCYLEIRWQPCHSYDIYNHNKLCRSIDHTSFFATTTPICRANFRPYLYVDNMQGIPSPLRPVSYGNVFKTILPKFYSTTCTFARFGILPLGCSFITRHCYDGKNNGACSVLSDTNAMHCHCVRSSMRHTICARSVYRTTLHRTSKCCTKLRAKKYGIRNMDGIHLPISHNISGWRLLFCMAQHL